MDFLQARQEWRGDYSVIVDQNVNVFDDIFNHSIMDIVKEISVSEQLQSENEDLKPLKPQSTVSSATTRQAAIIKYLPKLLCQMCRYKECTVSVPLLHTDSKSVTKVLCKRFSMDPAYNLFCLI